MSYFPKPIVYCSTSTIALYKSFTCLFFMVHKKMVQIVFMTFIFVMIQGFKMPLTMLNIISLLVINLAGVLHTPAIIKSTL